MKLTYTAYDHAGAIKSGSIEAAGTDEATEKLHQRGLFVTKIHEERGSAKVGSSSGGTIKVRTGRLKMLAPLTRQLAVLIRTGTPLVDALGAAEFQCKDEGWKAVLANVRQRVEEGESFSEALGAHPKQFDALTRSLVAAGETGGNLGPMLDRLAVVIRQQQHVRGALLGAMIYPVLLITVSLCVLTMMIMLVLPRFSEMFASLDAEIPLSTQMLMAISDWMRSNWWMVLIALVAVGVGGTAWLRTAAGRRVWHGLVLRMPVVGTIVRNFATAQIARVLGVMLNSRVPMLEAIGLTRDAVANVHYKDLLLAAQEAVTRGEPISRTFDDSDLITRSVCEAVRSGERSGSVGEVLVSVAEFMDEDNEVIVRSLTSIIEPVILIVLGALVAFIALSMFLPMFDLVASAPGA